METSKEQVLKEEYGIKLFGDTRVRTGYICKTDKGYKELRKLNCDEKKIMFMNSIQEHIHNKGFTNVNRFIQTKNDMPYIKISDNMYVLEEYKERVSLDMSEEKNLMAAMELMAKFHNASKGFIYEDGFYNNDGIVFQCDKRLKELNKIKKLIYRQSNKSDIDIMVFRNMDYYKNRVEKTKYIINSKGFDTIMEYSNSERSICHNNFKEETILMDNNRDFLLIGFDKATYDCTIMDLTEFFRQYLKQPEANEYTIKKMIEAYDKIRHISDQELCIIRGMLVFPTKFLKLCNKYYNKRRVIVSDSMVEKFGRCIEENKRTENIIKNI